MAEWFGEAYDASTPLGHVYLEQPTAQEAALFRKYANASIPFADIGNQYLAQQAQSLPSAPRGMSWPQAAAAMRTRPAQSPGPARGMGPFHRPSPPTSSPISPP
jgi:hypothetical protein